MKTVKIKISPPTAHSGRVGRIDIARVNATTEAEIQAHIAEDEKEAMLDAAKFARRVRKRLGLSQTEFSARIEVSVETIRNWEQGRRYPTGAAKTLLKILYRVPEASLSALH
jgi:putative transcriptional regulator